MKIVKSIIATLMGIGMIFVGGETVGLRASATSIKAPVPTTTIVAVTTGVSETETTTTTDTTTTIETERPIALGEGVTDIVTTESPIDLGTDVSSTNVDKAETIPTTTTNGTGDIAGITTRLSAWYETGIAAGTSATNIASTGIGVATETINTIGLTTTVASTTTTTVNGAPATSDSTGTGAICMLLAAGIIGGLLMVNGKRD